MSPAPDGGTVQFSVDGAVAGTAVVSGTGSATLSVAMAVGTHAVRASYSGDAGFGASAVAENIAIGQDPSALVVAAPTPQGPESFELRATLTSAGGPLPGATVWFASHGSELCSATTDRDGDAACTVSAGAGGLGDLTTAGVTATFGGDVGHLPVTAGSPSPDAVGGAIGSCDGLFPLGTSARGASRP